MINVNRRCPTHIADQVVNQLLDCQPPTQTRQGLHLAAQAFLRQCTDPDLRDQVLFSVASVNRALKYIENNTNQIHPTS